MEEEIEKNIIKVRNYISNIFNGFNVWKTLQNSDYNEIYNRNKHFWGIVIHSLQTEFLLGLAKIFEDRKEKDVLSIYYLLDLLQEGIEKEEIKDKINARSSIIENLRIWRNKILAHQDVYFAHNPKEIFGKFPIKNNEIEELMELLKEILGMIKSISTQKGHIYSFKVIEDESETDVKDIINNIETSYELQKLLRKLKFGV